MRQEGERCFCDGFGSARRARRSATGRWCEQTALAELLGVPAEKVNTERLYRGMDALWEQKEAIERHLKQRWTGLFDATYDLLLYDVTSRCFEGLADGNELAARGYSRDHRGAIASRSASAWW